MSYATDRAKARSLVPCTTRDTPPINVYVDVSCYTVLDLSSTNAYLATLTNMDAFGRLRVSNPFTLFEFSSIRGKNEYLIQELVTPNAGSASSTHYPGQSYVSMTAASGGSVVRQSREYIMYQPGKSKLVYMTGVLFDASGAGLTSRIGVFDASMGIFIQCQGTTLSVVERDFNDSPIDTVINRNQWFDKLDGTGPSGAVIDFTKAQIFYFDFEWLGVGQVRCGIIQAGRYLPYYTFVHKNELLRPYITMAKLPLRYEITNASATSRTMRMICGTVISEGGVSPLGQNFIYGNYLTTGVGVVDNAPAIRVPIMGIRLRSTFPFNRATLKLQKIDIISTSSNVAGSWQILRNPTINTAKFPSKLGEDWHDFATPGTITSESAVQVKLFETHTGGTPVAGDVSGGTVIYAGFYSQRNTTVISQTTDQLISAFPLTSNIAGTVSDEFILVANTVAQAGGAPKVFTALEWLEFI